MKVLIVDGSRERRRDLTEALAVLNNVTVQGAVADVRSALSALVEAAPDVIVTDVALPDGDGIHLVERVRRLASTPAVIVLAEHTSEEQRTHYLSAGADSYLDGTDFAGVRAAVIGFAATRFALGSIPPQETQRLLGRMTAGVVHDFNNYLNVTDISLDLLERGNRQPDLLANARNALDAMKRLNATLLSYARGSVPTTMPVDLGVVATETVALTRRVIATDIVVTVEIAEKLRPVLGVRPELEQVFLNLIINACDAMPGGGRLEIRVKQATSQAVLVEVSDTGVGFEDASKTAKAGRTGHGLGLAIVRNVVARQGGALRIVPRSSGGTTVALMLPTSSAS
jgi:signal transduction histidine kinase